MRADSFDVTIPRQLESQCLRLHEDPLQLRCSLPRTRAYNKGLKKRHIQMIAVGGAIGTGLFLGAGSRLNIAGPFLVVLYAIAGFFAFIVVRALGELVIYRPTSGSFVSLRP